MAELSLQHATTIVEAALRKARERLRIRPQIAMGKAWGALGMGVGSRTLARRVAEQPQQQAFFSALNAMSQGQVVPAAC